jgi:hypothetical protein
MKQIAAVALVTLLLAPAILAGDTTKPIRYTWIATSCETWNCAAAALVMADGSKYVIVLPTGEEYRPWVILRRVEEGAIVIPEDEPFVCEVFDALMDATARHQSMDSCHAALILNVPDGRSVVTSLSTCNTAKRRAVRK